MDGQLGKTKHYAIRVEFQDRGSPHIHALLWVENAPKLTEETKDEYIKHLDSTISGCFPNKSENPDLRELVKKYQVHSHSKTCRKYNKNECRFGFPKFFCKRTIISEPLSDDFSDVEKHEILVKRNNALNKVQDYISTNLHPKKNNILGDDQPDYIEVPSIDSILTELELTYNEYEEFLCISPDKDQHLHLKREPDSCFVNNYFSEGLVAWEANIDIQPVTSPYRCVSYLTAYFSKNENKTSSAMKEALKEAINLEKSSYEAMKDIAKAYNTNRECSVQEAVYLTMPELWLRKCFPAIQFVNTNLPDERYRVFKSEEEIEELEEDSPNVFKRNMLDRYIERPNSTFKNGKFSVFEGMCYAKFCANYELDTKKNCEDESDWQPKILNESVNSSNHNSTDLPKTVPLMGVTKEKLRCRKVQKVLRYYTPNKHKFPEKYAHHILMLFYPFRSEESDLKEAGSYVTKLNNDTVIASVNRNKAAFEPDGDLVESVLHNYQSEIVHNQDAFGQQENDEVNEMTHQSESNGDDDESDNEPREPEELHEAFTYKVHNLQSDSEINSHVRSLNQKQREIFDVVLDWAKKFLQNLKCKNVVKLEPICLFLTGGGGVGKSHLVKCIYDCVSKLLVYKSEELEKPRVIKLGPTGISAVTISGTTIHSGLKIPVNSFKSLTDKQRTLLRNKLMHVQLIIIDEISMVSSKLLLDIHKRLNEIFAVTDDRPFAGKSIIVCGDLYQLPPVMAKPVFSTEGLLINVFKLWHNFKLAELTETMRQKGDNSFIDLLNEIRVGDLSSEHETVLKSRIIKPEDTNNPWNALHLFAENDSVKMSTT